jgi:hypothetical protein
MEKQHDMDELTISAGDDGRSLASLYSWLLRSLDVAEHSTVRAEAGQDGESMSVLASIGVVVSSATAIANVLIAYKAWRDARTKAPAMTVTLNQITVSMDDPAAREKLIAALGDDGHAS